MNLPTKILIVFSAITVLIFFQFSTPSNETKPNDKYGILKSTPRMHANTKTWSNDDCPFTAKFPTNVKTGYYSKRKPTFEIPAEYSTQNFDYAIMCLVTREKVVDGVSIGTPEERALQHIEKFVKVGRNISNKVVEKIENTEFSHLENALYKVTFTIRAPDFKNQVSMVVFYNGIHLLSAMTFYNSDKLMPLNGIEFFETIRLK